MVSETHINLTELHKMTSEKSSETQQPSLEILRKAFAGSCPILGLSQSTCVALTLLLNSRAELATMLTWMLEQEDKGHHPDTTEVVLYAEKVRDYADKHPEVRMR